MRARQFPQGTIAMILPRLYVIVDIETLATRGVHLRSFAETLAEVGVGLVQLRDKNSLPSAILEHARTLRECLPDARLIMNDYATLAKQAGFDGVHVGQDDADASETSQILGSGAMVGQSTHNADQIRAAHESYASYTAIGPVFSTSTKLDADPVVGLEGVRLARSLTTKPLVAIGGITRQNCRSVIDAGADSVAVISALFAPNETVEEVARDFLRILR